MGLTQRQTTIMWILTVLLSALFAFGGIVKLIGTEETIAAFARYGYPGWFRMLVGVLELAGAVLLWIPNRAAEAGSFLIILMLGAIITNFRAGDSVIPPLLVLLMCGGLVSLRAEQVSEE